MIPLILLAAAVVLPGSRNLQRLQPHPTKEGGLRPGIPMVFGAVFALALGFLLVGEVTVVLAGAVVALCVGWTLRSMRRQRMAARTNDTLATFLGYLTADLSAGATPVTALQRAVEYLPVNAPGPCAAKLRTASSHAGRGGSAAEVLREEADAGHGQPGQLGQLTQLGKYWQVAEQHGISLAGMLGQAQSRLDTLRRHRRATTAALQGPQATAVVLTLLPVAGIGLGSVMGANPLGLLFGGGLGGILLLVGVSLSCSGFMWSRFIIARAAGEG